MRYMKLLVVVFVGLMPVAAEASNHRHPTLTFFSCEIPKQTRPPLVVNVIPYRMDGQVSIHSEEKGANEHRKSNLVLMYETKANFTRNEISFVYAKHDNVLDIVNQNLRFRPLDSNSAWKTVKCKLIEGEANYL